MGLDVYGILMFGIECRIEKRIKKDEVIRFNETTGEPYKKTIDHITWHLIHNDKELLCASSKKELYILPRSMEIRYINDNEHELHEHHFRYDIEDQRCTKILIGKIISMTDSNRDMEPTVLSYGPKFLISETKLLEAETLIREFYKTQIDLDIKLLHFLEESYY